MSCTSYRMQSGLPTCGTGLRWHVQLFAAIIFFLFPDVVWAQDADNTAATTSATRPAILSNRWQEDWSVLADPQVRESPATA
jgi:hypothetical protein